MNRTGSTAPLVSVVIPAFNAALYITEALDSVLGQTCTDYEILVIDDGSTDHTAEILETRYPGVRCYRTPNLGVSRARNLGIHEARGRFIAFLDADDIWLPHKLEKQLELLARDPNLMMIFTESVTFDEQSFYANPYSKRSRLMTGDLVRNIFLYSYVGTPTVIVRREVFEEVGMFETGLRAAEDDNLWMRIAARFKVDLLDEVLVHIRIRAGSITTTGANLFDGVNAHIALLASKYPELMDRIGSEAVRQKIAAHQFLRGYAHFSEGRPSQARAHFARSFRTRPRLKTLSYFCGSCIPARALSTLKQLRRNIRAAMTARGGQSRERPC